MYFAPILKENMKQNCRKEVSFKYIWYITYFMYLSVSHLYNYFYLFSQSSHNTGFHEFLPFWLSQKDKKTNKKITSFAFFL